MNFFKNFFAITLSIFLTLFFLEILLVLKSKMIIDYDTEMWRYSKELKQKSLNKKINHIHKKNKEAYLQNVLIKTNNYGMRDSKNKINDWNKSKKKILLLGSSITLGWGVEEKYILNSQLNKFAKENRLKWLFLNAGVGNYNFERSLNNYLENLASLEPDIIIFQFFLNDIEKLPSNNPNFITKNFHLGILFWKFINKFKDDLNFSNIYNYYEKAYNKDGEDYLKYNFKIFKDYCKNNKVRCIIAYTPDIQFLERNKFDNFEEIVRKNSKVFNLEFISFTENLRSYDKNLKNKYRDNHPNKFAHKIMAKKIFEYLN